MRKKRKVGGVGSRENLLGEQEEDMSWDGTNDSAPGGLTSEEKRFLLLVERGDVASIKR
jgi:hypothetical protein